MENCVKLHFSEAGFRIFELGRKWGFNLIQTRTKTKKSTDTIFRHCKMIICTKFRA